MRQKMYQRNGAPRGYGQQSGNSIFLDNPEQSDTMPQGRPERYEGIERDAAAITQQIQQPTQGRDAVQNAMTALMGGGSAIGNQLRSRLGNMGFSGAGQEGQGGNDPYASLRSAMNTRIPPEKLAAITGVGYGVEGSPMGDQARGAMHNGAERPISPVGLEGSNFGRMKGYDAANWENGMNSAKYNAGRIISRYAASPNGLRQAVESEDFQRHFPGARITGSQGDEIDFGDLFDDHSGTVLGTIDVGENFDINNPDAETNYGWDLKGLAGGGQKRMPTMSAATMGGGDSDALMQALLQGGGGGDFDQILQMLLQGEGQPVR